jgi:Carboxypeptidase regulatory-like domain/TonB dependent receptor
VKRSLWGWILPCILSTAILTLAQTATTSLRGTIKDPGGALVPGATISITDNDTGNTFNTTANVAGAYQFPQIPPAKYTIRVSAAGFGNQVKAAELLVNQPATIDFNLTIEANTVTVDVSGEVQTLNTSDASLGNSAANAVIQALPSETRNVPDLLSLQPGVLYLPSPGYGAGDSRSGSVNGSRSDQGNVTLDGVDDNDQVGGFAFTGVLRATQDSIEEFRVVTGNSNADAGRSSGAQVSMVTKSGTNRFHGAVYEYHRPTFTVANDWFNKQAQTANGLPNIPGKLIRNIFGGDLGGPVKKDKLFFFANYEGARQAENQQVSRTAPTASYQAGNLVYPDASGNPVTITQAQMAQLDAGCLVCNTGTYPNPPGDNPNALAYFNSMPAANGTNLGDGYNTGSYTFSSPAPVHLNTSIAKLDYTPSDRHRFFVRGNLQDDRTDYAEQFPGQPPEQTLADNSKGITAGHTWTISQNLVNDLRYGFVRQGYGNYGVGKGQYVEFRFIDHPTAETRNTIVSVPVQNVIDNLSWTKGNHTLQFGANWRLIHQNNSSDGNSWSSATTNPYWLGGHPPTPTDSDGNSLVPSAFANSYQIAFANMVGTVPQITQQSNYQVNSATAGSLLAQGAFTPRHFSTNEFEWYAQDSWRVKPNLTLTFGLRHTILQTPWETSGQQVTPTVDTHTWYMQREAAAQAGQIFEQDLLFSPSGKFYSKPGFWPMNKANFAPRVAIAYSPDVKTSLRAGFGMYYDHFGQALVSTFSQLGSFGLTSSVSNPAGVYAITGTSPFCGTPGCAPQGTRPAAPRFMDRNTLPPIDLGAAPATIAYPYLYPQNNFSIQWGLDSKIKTPYSETFDLSVQREFPKGFSFEAAYVGRLGRHLLEQLDLAEPVDYVDPMGAGDYYAAGTQLSKLVDQNGGNYGIVQDGNGNNIGSVVNVPAIQYFENVFPFMAGVDYGGESATQAIYNNEWAPYRSQYGATTSLSDIDFYCGYGCPAGWQSHFWQDQFSSLFALSSIGMSYYNGMQLTLRHPTTHGLLVDVGYTWSHSIDMGSSTERSNEFGSQSTNTGSFSEILNTWKPYLNRASSDFDTRHLLTVDWVYAMPFGRGKALAGNVNGIADAFIGGWQWSGINRWSSGLPFFFTEPGWTTNWQIESFGVQTGPIKMHKHYDQNHNPQFFANPDAINNGVACGGCNGGNIRLPYPGEAGQRNNFRGDGFFDIDSGLAKTWKLREFGAIHFEWEVYNVTNSVRFDVSPANIGEGLTGGNLGVSSATLSVPRRMQFALRYDF